MATNFNISYLADKISSENVAKVPPPSQKFVVPPPNVLWAWLSYVYEQTGEWLMPPVELPAVLPAAPAKETALAAKQPVETDPTLAYQMPFPTMLPFAATAKNASKRVNAPSKETVTGFDYVNSVYYTEAIRLIEKYRNEQLSADIISDCVRVLTLIIAWSSHPLFRDTLFGKTVMALSFSRCARELHLRAVRFKESIEKLERTGIIATGTVGEGIISPVELQALQQAVKEPVGEVSNYWQTRSFQNKTIFYKLAITESLSLPVFEPGTTCNVLTETGNTTGNSKAVRKVFPPAKNISETLAKSFPNTLDSCIEYYDDESRQTPGNIKADKTNEVRYTPEQQAKYDFLSQRASFPGYVTAQGQSVLDVRQIHKFALDTNLQLDIIEQRYKQVLAMWLAGKCHSNPLGLLHWCLSHNTAPQTDRSPKLPKPERSLSASRSPRKPSKKSLSGWQKALNLSPENIGHELKTMPDVHHDFAAIWQQVRQDDLPTRFNLGRFEQDLLANSTLRSSADNQLAIVLNSSLELRLLNEANRNVIRIALRQKLGGNYSFAFSAPDAEQ
jgi:hypothetical protein